MRRRLAGSWPSPVPGAEAAACGRTPGTYRKRLGSVSGRRPDAAGLEQGDGPRTGFRPSARRTWSVPVACRRRARRARGGRPWPGQVGSVAGGPRPGPGCPASAGRRRAGWTDRRPASTRSGSSRARRSTPSIRSFFLGFGIKNSGKTASPRTGRRHWACSGRHRAASAAGGRRQGPELPGESPSRGLGPNLGADLTAGGSVALDEPPAAGRTGQSVGGNQDAVSATAEVGRRVGARHIGGGKRS